MQVTMFFWVNPLWWLWSEINEAYLVLLANKVDLPTKQVTYDQGKSIAEKHGYKFFETSAKTGKNVIEGNLSHIAIFLLFTFGWFFVVAFETISNMVVAQLQKKEENGKGKNDKPQSLRAQQRNIIQRQKRLCCSIS